MAINYYVVLGVSQDADAEAIRSAFRALARRYHPDAGEGSSADRFREILTAYETLNDPARRGRYDRILQNRHRRTVQVVEPLRAQAAREPMRSLEELIDELFQRWDEVFFGVPRRRDRV